MPATDFQTRVKEAVAFLSCRIDAPEIGVVLGTGLGGLPRRMADAVVVPYEEIPHFPRSTVQSHAGNLVAGTLAGKKTAILQGRFHFYEGYSAREATLPVRVLTLLGINTLVVTNASGGLNPAFSPGTLMVVSDHINLIPDNPLRGANHEQWGPRFPDLSQAYDPALQTTALAAAAALGISNTATGVYVAIPGPSLETPAETRWLRSIGADAVGMSSVPEVIVARHAGVQVLGISLVANVNNPDNMAPIVLDEILAQAGKSELLLQNLLHEVLRQIPGR